MTIDFGGLANSEQNISWKIEANIDQGFEDAKAETILEGKIIERRKKIRSAEKSETKISKKFLLQSSSTCN